MGPTMSRQWTCVPRSDSSAAGRQSTSSPRGESPPSEFGLEAEAYSIRRNPWSPAMEVKSETIYQESAHEWRDYSRKRFDL